MREIWPDGPRTGDHWPTQPDLKIYRQFPKTNSQASQFIIDFESFVGDLASSSLMAPK